MKHALLLSLILLAAPARAAEPETPGAVWSEPSGRGALAIGLAHGAFGGAFTQELRLKITFLDHLGIMLRPMIMYSLGTDRMDVGGRIGVFGQTDALLNILRVYGGGGATLVVPVGDSVGESKLRAGFGGHVGLEAFLNAGFSFFVEVGGNGLFSETVGSGGTFMGGMHWYL